MSSAVSRFATEEPTACAVCRRHAVWLGYGPPKRERVWLPVSDVSFHCHVDLVHRPVPPTVAGEVQNQAVSFAFGLAGAAADHLHVESGRQRRPQQGE
jgi:hypothetical protein